VHATRADGFPFYFWQQIIESVLRSNLHQNQCDAHGPGQPGQHGSGKRQRAGSFFASVKFVGAEKGFFWAVWSYASFARGMCLDAGFSADVPAALQAINAAPAVGRSRVALMDPRLAYATFAMIWLASPVVDPGTRVPEDRAYEIARSHQWDPPAHEAKPPRREKPPQPRAGAVGRQEARSSRTAAAPAWCLVLGIGYPCSLEEVRRAFRAGVLKAHPDHGGTSEAFVRLKTAYDHALKEVGK